MIIFYIILFNIFNIFTQNIRFMINDYILYYVQQNMIYITNYIHIIKKILLLTIHQYFIYHIRQG